MNKQNKKLTVPYEPYGDLIYIIKTYLEIKDMMEVTSGDYIVKETHLTDNDVFSPIKETDLTEWDNNDKLRHINSEYSTCDENSSQASFNDIYDEFSRFLSQDCDDVDVKETSLLDDDFTKETSQNDVKDVKETDLCGDIYSSEDNVRETDLTSLDEGTLLKGGTCSNGISSSHNTVKETDLIDVGDKYCVAKLSPQYVSPTSNDVDNDVDNDPTEETDIERDKLILSYDGDNISFQDIETDFFETDIETNEDHDHTDLNEKIKFQDIESDFFETDCEATENEIFFNVSKSSNAHEQTVVKSLSQENIKNEIDLTHETKNSRKPVRRQLFDNKTETLSNTLLRSTINELEKALNDSNVLLAKRDQKIQNLRSGNAELKKGLNRELDNVSKIKLKLLEKEALLSENELKVAELQRELEVTNKQLSDFRLYELNNFHETDSSIDFDQVEENPNFYSRKNSKSENTYERSSSTRKISTTSEIDFVKTTPSCCHKNKLDRSSASQCQQQNTRQPTNELRSKTDTDERVSKTELHSNLRMRFMRDAFFYYMIGFHPDEQINAILAILDYGDKRQDFVLEAHKLKQSGKKFNVTKVSSRGLTFVQQQTAS